MTYIFSTVPYDGKFSFVIKLNVNAYLLINQTILAHTAQNNDAKIKKYVRNATW